jgi:ABC-type uncharacterized transport system permease subunit
MNNVSKFVRCSWLCVALALEYGSTVGGDTSILSGWALMVWTAPASMLFQFHLYDTALQYMTRSNAQILGAVFEVLVAYAFWFVFIPKIWPTHKKE